MTDTDRQTRIQAARDSFSGRGLTDSQLRDAWALSGVLHTHIQKTGSFREALTDYAHAFARGERFDALRAEAILRDVYGARYEQSLNQTREGLLEREKALPETAQTRAGICADTIEDLIRSAPTQPFYQAYDRAAVSLANELQITQSGAKALMKDAYRAAHGRDLYEAGKAVEEACHKPAREAEIAARKAEGTPQRARGQSRD